MSSKTSETDIEPQISRQRAEMGNWEEAVLGRPERFQYFCVNGKLAYFQG